MIKHKIIYFFPPKLKQSYDSLSENVTFGRVTSLSGPVL